MMCLQAKPEKPERLAFVRQMRRATMGISVMPAFSASLRGSCMKCSIKVQHLKLRMLRLQIVQETWRAVE